MTELTSVLLEFSIDPLTDTTPAWTNVTSDCQGIEWWSGVDNEGDEPQPGGAVIRLRNTLRRWEPDYTGGAFYPNIVYGRRFRLTLNDGTGATQEGLWYITDIAIDYPTMKSYSEVTITCADGFEVLALDDLPSLDPPDAESYADVVGFDEPWGYWRLGEPSGTQVVSQTRVIKRGHGKKRRKFRRRISRVITTAELEGVSGPTGVYRGTPTLGVSGALLGDSDTAISFSGASSEYAELTGIDSSTFAKETELTVECWVNLNTTTGDQMIIAGPVNSGGSGAEIFSLAYDDTTFNNFVFRLRLANGNSLTLPIPVAVSTGTWYYLAGHFKNGLATIFLDGALTESAFGIDRLLSPTGTVVRFGRSTTATAQPLNGMLDEIAIYEAGIGYNRIGVHRIAGSQSGWPQQTAGTRIADIATHALWSEAGIQTTGRSVQPQMKHGQARLEEISELMQAEGPQTLFFFNGSGDPVYLGWDWKGTSVAYNTTQATFGDGAGEVAYEGVELIYDNETFNVVEASREGGELVSVGAGGTPRRVNPDFTDLLLSDDADVSAVANNVLDVFGEPAMRPKSVTVNGAKAVSHILDRQIGHQVRVRKRGTGGAVAVDRISHILGYRKTLGTDKHITCTWNLARGFNASLSEWRLGITGYTELNSTAVLA